MLPSNHDAAGAREPRSPAPCARPDRPRLREAARRPDHGRKALMSPAHFSRRFRAAYGETPYGYLMTRRIERAMALLRAGASVTDACMAVGCTSLGSFSSRFAEIVGETPTVVPRATSTTPSRRCRRASRWRTRARRARHRAGSEKRPRRPRRSVADMTIALQYTQHHRQRRRRVDRLLPRRARPRGAERRRLGRATAGSRSAATRSPDSGSCSRCRTPAARRPTATRCRSCSPRASCR